MANDQNLEDLANKEPNIYVQIIFGDGNRTWLFLRDAVTLDIHGPELAVRNKKSKELLVRCYGQWAHRDISTDLVGPQEEKDTE